MYRYFQPPIKSGIGWILTNILKRILVLKTMQPLQIPQYWHAGCFAESYLHLVKDANVLLIMICHKAPIKL